MDYIYFSVSDMKLKKVSSNTNTISKYTSVHFYRVFKSKDLSLCKITYMALNR